MLYLMQGILASAQFLIMVWICSISRSRCGLSPSMDGRIPLAVDVARRQEGRVENIHGEIVFGGGIGEALELVHGGVEASVGNLRARHDVPDAPPAERLESLLRVAGRAAAASAASFAGRGCRGSALPAAAGAFRRTASHYGGAEFHEGPLRRCGRGGGGGTGGKGGREGTRGEELTSVHYSDSLHRRWSRPRKAGGRRNRTQTEADLFLVIGHHKSRRGECQCGTGA